MKTCTHCCLKRKSTTNTQPAPVTTLGHTGATQSISKSYTSVKDLPTNKEKFYKAVFTALFFYYYDLFYKFVLKKCKLNKITKHNLIDNKFQ